MSAAPKGEGARERILAAVRARAGGKGDPPPANASPPPSVPADLDAFCARLEATGATVERVAGPGDVPGAVARHLAARNLAPRAVVAPALAGLPWDSVPMLEVREGSAGVDDGVAVVPALAGVAETGSIVHASGPDDPTINHFLPDNAVAVLRADDVAGSLEEAFARGRGGVAMPRALCLITGPSRTGDIEQRIELGAHGPRALHVVVTEGEASARESP